MDIESAAYIKEFEEEILVMGVAVALPTKSLDLVVDALNPARRSIIIVFVQTGPTAGLRWIVLALREKNPVLEPYCILPYEGQADKWSDSARER